MQHNSVEYNMRGQEHTRYDVLESGSRTNLMQYNINLGEADGEWGGGTGVNPSPLLPLIGSEMGRGV